MEAGVAVGDKRGHNQAADRGAFSRQIVAGSTPLGAGDCTQSLAGIEPGERLLALEAV